MADFAYRFAQQEPDNGAATILLAMADPTDRAFGADLMGRLAFPTIQHARDYVAAAQGRLAASRAELRRILQIPEPADRYELLMRQAGWRWRQARIECRRIRASREVLVTARARVRRYLEEALQEAFADEAAKHPEGRMVFAINNN